MKTWFIIIACSATLSLVFSGMSTSHQASKADKKHRSQSATTNPTFANAASSISPWERVMPELVKLLSSVGKDASLLGGLGGNPRITQPYRDNFLGIDVPFITYDWEIGYNNPNQDKPMYLAQARVGVSTKTVDGLEASIMMCPPKFAPSVAQIWSFLSRKEPDVYYSDAQVASAPNTWNVCCYLKTDDTVIEVNALCLTPPVIITNKTDFRVGGTTAIINLSPSFSLDRTMVSSIYLGPSRSLKTGRKIEPTGEHLPPARK